MFTFSYGFLTCFVKDVIDHGWHINSDELVKWKVPEPLVRRSHINMLFPIGVSPYIAKPDVKPKIDTTRQAQKS